MFVLFFDTETNGLPQSKNALTSNLANWPIIVQIAWQLWDFTDITAAKRIEADSYIIQPDTSVVWNAESAAIHGISKDTAIEKGVSRTEVLNAFMLVAKKAHVLCAHNLAFDKPVLKAEYLRQNTGEVFRWWPAIEYCTMENTKNILKLPSKFGKAWDPYKMPRLAELHKYLYGEDVKFEWHSAAGDVECLVSCFHELLRRRIVPLDTWLRNERGERRVLDTDKGSAK
jgi:DNA polymerase III epsilon subunit-like protein